MCTDILICTQNTNEYTRTLENQRDLILLHDLLYMTTTTMMMMINLNLYKLMSTLHLIKALMVFHMMNSKTIYATVLKWSFVQALQPSVKNPNTHS